MALRVAQVRSGTESTAQVVAEAEVVIPIQDAQEATAREERVAATAVEALADLRGVSAQQGLS